MQNMTEKLVLPVASGVILWLITNRLLQPPPTPPTPTPASVKAEASPTTPMPASSQDPPLPWRAVPPQETKPDATAARTPATSTVARSSATSTPPAKIETIFLEDRLAQYREGEETLWGAGAFVKLGQDKHPWLVAHADGLCMVGRNVALPNQFTIECRYFAPIPEVTRGVMGWWKQPLTSRIVLIEANGTRHTIEWQLGCEQESWRPTAIGAPLFAKKYYHNLKLPTGITNEVRVKQPSGLLQISRNGEIVTVAIDGQVVISGPMGRMENLARFEIGLQKTSNGTLSLTDFKVAQ